MDFNVKISDLTIGQHFEGFYILKEAEPPAHRYAAP